MRGSWRAGLQEHLVVRSQTDSGCREADEAALAVVGLRRERILVDEQVNERSLYGQAHSGQPGYGACYAVRTTLIRSPAAASPLVACVRVSPQSQQKKRLGRGPKPVQPPTPPPCASHRACRTGYAALRARARAKTWTHNSALLSSRWLTGVVTRQAGNRARQDCQVTVPPRLSSLPAGCLER